MLTHYLNVLKHFRNLSGRSPRAEYWSFILFSFLCGLESNPLIRNNLADINRIVGNARGIIVQFEERYE